MSIKSNITGFSELCDRDGAHEKRVASAAVHLTRRQSLYRHNFLGIDPHERLRVNPHKPVSCRIGGIDPTVAQLAHPARRRECRGGQSLAGKPFSATFWMRSPRARRNQASPGHPPGTYLTFGNGGSGAPRAQLTGPQERNVDTTLRRLKARQTNFTHDSIDALHRRIVVWAHCFSEVDDMAGTQAEAAAIDAYAPSGATNTCP